MKVGDLVLYKGDPSIIGLLTGSHMTTAHTSALPPIKLWHVHWIVDGGYNVDPVTHETEGHLEVFDEHS